LSRGVEDLALLGGLLADDDVLAQGVYDEGAAAAGAGGQLLGLLRDVRV